jgi:chromosome segregation ATPase
MPAEPGQHLAEHARQRHQQALQRTQQTLAEMNDAGETVTVALIARRAGVSRSWIYTQPALRDQIQQLQRHRADAETTRKATIRASDDSLRQRLALAHERIGQLRAENQQLRDALAHAHGQLRASRLNVQDELPKTPVHETKPQVDGMISRSKSR